jgi:1-acyl-sn-glycerol-3-phosphate acyltransferase
MTLRSSAKAQLPEVSARIFKLFAAYSRWYILRRFHAVRILRKGLPSRRICRPLLIYLNHASWWDPLVCVYLCRRFFPDKTSFAPMDADSLRRYAFLKYLGIYGIEQHSARGAITFLRTTTALLKREDNAIWLTPQGRFVDARQRPVRLQRGIGALASRATEGAFLPLAIEYAFWTEPQPEILVSFGEITITGKEPLRKHREWTEHFSCALEATQEKLAIRSCRRDLSDWLVMDRGASGVSPFYDAWRLLRARLRGEDFKREHQPEKRS